MAYQYFVLLKKELKTVDGGEPRVCRVCCWQAVRPVTGDAASGNLHVGISSSVSFSKEEGVAGCVHWIC